MQENKIKSKLFGILDFFSFTLAFLFSLNYFLKSVAEPIDSFLIGFMCLGLGFVSAGLFGYLAYPFLTTDKKQKYYLLISCIGFIIIILFGVVYNIVNWLS